MFPSWHTFRRGFCRLLAKRALRWGGHVERMETNRLPKQVFYSELAVGRRPIGRPKKRYKDHVKDTLKRCNIPPNGFERTATDRDEWRRAINTGMDHYELTLRERNEAARRARHHQNRQLRRPGIYVPGVWQSVPMWCWPRQSWEGASEAPAWEWTSSHRWSNLRKQRIKHSLEFFIIISYLYES